MIVTVSLDVKWFSAFMTDVERRQVPWATVLGLNYTAEDAQGAIIDRMRSRGFKIRSAISDAWLTRQIYFGRNDRASKSKLSAMVTIRPQAGVGRSSLLPLLEDGFLRRSNRIIGSDKVFGIGSIAIPNRGRNALRQIDRSLYPSMLGLQERLGPSGFQKVKVKVGKQTRMQFVGLKGKHRTFVVRTGAGTGQIRQRIGSDKKATILLFRIRPPKPVMGRRFFYETAQLVGQEQFAKNFRRGFAEAMATAR